MSPGDRPGYKISVRKLLQQNTQIYLTLVSDRLHQDGFLFCSLYTSVIWQQAVQQWAQRWRGCTKSKAAGYPRSYFLTCNYSKNAHSWFEGIPLYQIEAHRLCVPGMTLTPTCGASSPCQEFDGRNCT